MSLSQPMSFSLLCFLSSLPSHWGGRSKQTDVCVVGFWSRSGYNIIIPIKYFCTLSVTCVCIGKIANACLYFCYRPWHRKTTWLFSRLRLYDSPLDCTHMYVHMYIHIQTIQLHCFIYPQIVLKFNQKWKRFSLRFWKPLAHVNLWLVQKKEKCTKKYTKICTLLNLIKKYWEFISFSYYEFRLF